MKEDGHRVVWRAKRNERLSYIVLATTRDNSRLSGTTN